MDDSVLLTAADVQLMQSLAQQVTAVRPDLVNSDASYGELAWNWGKGYARAGESWLRRLWFSGADPVAWGWARLPHRARRSDGSVADVTSACLVYQVHPDHSELVDEVIDWYDTVAARPRAHRRTVRRRWVLPGAMGGARLWHRSGLARRHGLLDSAQRAGPRCPGAAGAAGRLPVPHRRRGRAAGRGPGSSGRLGSVDVHGRGLRGVRRTPPYRGDLHVLVEAPDGTMAASTVMWLDEANRTAEFEPVGTHPSYRRLGLGRAMLLHGMHLAREAGAGHMTVACLGAPGYPAARGLYDGVGFRPLSRDVPLIKPRG
ncbi:GNAT family N-acetyltransferase [Streptomyces lasalocidi]